MHAESSVVCMCSVGLAWVACHGSRAASVGRLAAENLRRTCVLLIAVGCVRVGEGV